MIVLVLRDEAGVAAWIALTRILGISIRWWTSSGWIFCIDGEVSFIMHAGNTALLVGISPLNILHIVIYNRGYAPTGNHPVTTRRENSVSLARGFPHEQKFFVDDVKGLEKAYQASNGSKLILVAVNRSTQSNRPAPSETLHELKQLFMESLL